MQPLWLDKPLSKIISENSWKSIFTENDVTEIEVSAVPFENSIIDIKARLKTKLVTGRCSTVLIEQLARHSMGIYEKFLDEIHCYHMQTILDTIECVENGKSANIRLFNGQLLKGLKHVHHNASTFLVNNLLNHWRSKCTGKNELEYQNELLNNTYNKLLLQLPEEEAKRKALAVLLNQLQTETAFRSNRQSTGEWIVFAEIDSIRYYLCLATHSEARKTSDQIIVDRLTPCLHEFPILKRLIHR